MNIFFIYFIWCGLSAITLGLMATEKGWRLRVTLFLFLLLGAFDAVAYLIATSLFKL